MVPFRPTLAPAALPFQSLSKSDPRAEYRLNRAGHGADIGYGFNRFSEVRFWLRSGLVGCQAPPGHAGIRFPERTDRRLARFGWLVSITPERSGDPSEWRERSRTSRWYDTGPGGTNSFRGCGFCASALQAHYPACILVRGQRRWNHFGSSSIGFPQFFLGGSNRLSAYGTNELFGNQFYFFRAGYLHDLLTLPPLAGKKVYAIAGYEFGKMYGFADASKFPNDFGCRRSGRDRGWTFGLRRKCRR